MQRRRTSRSANRPKSSLRRGEPTSPAGRSWVWAAALVLLVVVVYWPTLANGFVWDDEVHVASSSDPASPASLRTIWVNRNSVLQYYPLTQSTFWTEYRLWGLDPLGYHVVNLLLHAVTVLFAWRYRQANSAARYEPDWDHSIHLELFIWAAPLLIIIGLGALTWVGTHLLDPYRTLGRIKPGEFTAPGWPRQFLPCIRSKWKASPG